MQFPAPSCSSRGSRGELPGVRVPSRNSQLPGHRYSALRPRAATATSKKPPKKTKGPSARWYPKLLVAPQTAVQSLRPWLGPSKPSSGTRDHPRAARQRDQQRGALGRPFYPSETLSTLHLRVLLWVIAGNVRHLRLTFGLSRRRISGANIFPR